MLRRRLNCLVNSCQTGASGVGSLAIPYNTLTDRGPVLHVLAVVADGYQPRPKPRRVDSDTYHRVPAKLMVGDPMRM